MAGLQPADYSHSLTLCLFVFTLCALREPERAGLFYNRPSRRINLCHSDSVWAAASPHCLWQRTERPHGQEGRMAALWKIADGSVSLLWCLQCDTGNSGSASLWPDALCVALSPSTHSQPCTLWGFVLRSGSPLRCWQSQCWKVIKGLCYSKLRNGAIEMRTGMHWGAQTKQLGYLCRGELAENVETPLQCFTEATCESETCSTWSFLNLRYCNSAMPFYLALIGRHVAASPDSIS